MGDALVPNDPSGAARYVLAVRRMIKEAIAEDVIHNPAIDMLLTLFLAEEDSWMTPAQVCAASTVSEDGCRRWGTVLAERNLILMDDGRYRLSDRGREVMDKVASGVWSLADEHLRR